MGNLKKLKYSKPDGRNKIDVQGYEPYFNKYVKVATIYLPHEENNHLIINGKYYILHAHGYYPNHDYGNRVVQYCKENYG